MRSRIKHFVAGPYPAGAVESREPMKALMLGTVKFLRPEDKDALDRICGNLEMDEEGCYLSMFRKALLGEDSEYSDSPQIIDFFWWQTHREKIEQVCASQESFAQIQPAIEAQIAIELRDLHKNHVMKRFFERIPERLLLPWFESGVDFDIESPFTFDEMEAALEVSNAGFETFVELRLEKLREEFVRIELGKKGLKPDEPSVVKDRLLGRTYWPGTKSEFARLVNEQYQMNGDRFASLRDATYRMFDGYAFSDSKWTREKCYDLVRRT